MITNKYKINYISKQHLTAENIKEVEIAILNFKLMQEDRENNTKFGEIVVYVHNTLKISKLNWFEKTEFLALRITDSTKEVFNIILMYKSQNLSKEDNYKLMKEVLFTSDKSENILLVGNWNTFQNIKILVIKMKLLSME